MASTTCDSGSPVRVLLVEDHADTRDTLALLLRRWGYSVKTCCTGQEALDAAPGFIPELVLLDLGLPGIDGYYVAEHLETPGEKATLIALSGYGQRDDVERCRQAGFAMHLLKPIPPDTLKDALLECQARRKAAPPRDASLTG